MPMPIHMWVTGKTQGEIKGGCDQSGREGSILVQAVAHTIEIPSDPQSGMPVGKRVHRPLIITKTIDPASPQLYFALTHGEMMTVKLDWYRIDPSGTEENYYRTELEDAILVSVREYFPCVFDAETEQYQHMEELALTYRKIRWSHLADGKESEDDWKLPATA